MLKRIYLGLGTALLAWTAVAAFLGQEYRSTSRVLPIPGQAIRSSWGSGSSSHSSSSRSGGSIFGGK